MLLFGALRQATNTDSWGLLSHLVYVEDRFRADVAWPDGWTAKRVQFDCT